MKKAILFLVAIITLSLGMISCQTHQVVRTTTEYQGYQEGGTNGEWHQCSVCNGKGICYKCNGTGKLSGDKCSICKGTGKCRSCNGNGGFLTQN